MSNVTSNVITKIIVTGSHTKQQVFAKMDSKAKLLVSFFSFLFTFTIVCLKKVLDIGNVVLGLNPNETKFQFQFQYKLRSTAFVTTCSLVPLVGIGVYLNDSKFYDKLIMPIVQFCPPEFSHRMAVLAFKYNLIPKQRTVDSERLVSGHFFITNIMGVT